ALRGAHRRRRVGERARRAADAPGARDQGGPDGTVRACVRGRRVERLPRLLPRRRRVRPPELRRVREPLRRAGRRAAAGRRGGAARPPRRGGRSGTAVMGYFAASLRASADFLRAAVLRWRMPRLTALSMVRIASRTASRAEAPSAARAAFTGEGNWLPRGGLR